MSPKNETCVSRWMAEQGITVVPVGTTSVPVRGMSVSVREAEPSPISFCKYVILAQDGREHPLVFSQDIQHSSMVPLGYKAVGAGFVLICGSQVRVIEGHGSSTLHLDPRPQDQSILRTFLSRPSPALAPANASEQAVNPVNPVNPVNQVPSLPPAAEQSCSSVPVRVSP